MRESAMTIRQQMGKVSKISPIHPVSVSPFHVSFLVPALPGYGVINYLKKYEGQKVFNREPGTVNPTA